MKTLATLLAFLLAAAAQAQAPSPAQMGITSTTTPEVLQTLDSSKTWVPLGTVDATNHVFTAFGGAGTDVRAFGCVAYGVTDQGACINNALAKAPGCVIIPDTPNGFLVTSTIVVRTCLKGQHVSTANTYPNFVYPGASAILCNVGANGVCIDAATANTLGQTPQIENLTISGIAGTPPAGSKGLRVNGGYNSRFKGVAVFNFDSCVVVGPAGSVAPISMNFYDINLGRCRSHYFTVDGAPEVRVHGGRWGLNGSGEFNALDFVYLTNTAGAIAQGPNTILFEGLQMNPGTSGSGVQCAIRWGSYAATPSIPGIYWFVDDYIEWHTDHTPGPTGIFCSDSTVPSIPALFVRGMVTSTGGTSTTIFALDPATTPSQWWITDNTFGSTGMILHTGNPASLSASQIHLSNNAYGSNATIIADTNKAEVISTGNHYAALTISGQFGHLSMNGDLTSAGLTDTATGNIESTSTLWQTFTPHLKFAGVEPADIAYASRSGSYTRNSSGGFDVSLAITLSNKGTASAGDLATVTGWPYACSSGFGATPMMSAGAFAGLTGALQAWMSGSVIGLGQAGTTGMGQIPYSTFTNTTGFNLTVSCGRAL